MKSFHLSHGNLLRVQEILLGHMVRGCTDKEPSNNWDNIPVTKYSKRGNC